MAAKKKKKKQPDPWTVEAAKLGERINHRSVDYRRLVANVIVRGLGLQYQDQPDPETGQTVRTAVLTETYPPLFSPMQAPQAQAPGIATPPGPADGAVRASGLWTPGA